MNKAEMRRERIARRDALAPEARSRLAEALFAHVTALPEYRAARSVLATMAIGSEWDTRRFIDRARADGKKVVLPRVSSKPPKRLELYEVADPDRDLKPGVWDIPEPDPERCTPCELADVDFALVPALAVDAHGYRLGYGAGYFDKLLAGRGARPFCVTALPADFHVERLANEPHDVPVDLVIDESGPVSRDRPPNP